MQYNGGSLDCCSPSDTMPSSRSNLTRPHLTLDEPSFQGLLSAAYTIQEHNDRRKQDSSAPPEPTAEPSLEQTTCPHCGVLKATHEAACGSCGLGELRPGERLQRNWASMWLMSQEQELWHGRSSKEGEPKNGADEIVEPRGLIQRGYAAQSGQTNETSAELNWPTSESDLSGMESEAFPNELKLADPAFQFSESGAFLADETGDEAETFSEGPTQSEMGRLANWRVTLRFHRADLYLGIAIFVALTALLWPASTVPQKASLSPMDRILVKLGVAEAAVPAPHLRGDPAAQVWVDPHTALYYCAGEDQYGKTPDGRISTQKDAQFDRFEPAGRSACE